MIIIGAKGFAKELLEVCLQLGFLDHLVFFDNLSDDREKLIFQQFPVLQSEEEVVGHFTKYDNRFVLGLGNPVRRQKMSHTFESWGGQMTSIISPHAHLGSFGIEIGAGATILANATISNSAKIGKGLLMYTNAIVTHDCQLGDYVELSPGATILGNCTIGHFSHIGANTTILPNVKVGNHVTIGAGSLVTTDIPDHCTVKGIPAR